MPGTRHGRGLTTVIPNLKILTNCSSLHLRQESLNLWSEKVITVRLRETVLPEQPRAPTQPRLSMSLLGKTNRGLKPAAFSPCPKVLRRNKSKGFLHLLLLYHQELNLRSPLFADYL